MPLTQTGTLPARATQTSFTPAITSNQQRLTPHINSWHRIHRTRRGAYVPVTACPAGANTLLAVMSGSLEVLVYAPADGLPCLKPTFGNTPCSPSGAKDTSLMYERKESRSDPEDATVNEKLAPKQSGWVGDETTAEKRGAESNVTPNPSPRGLLDEALGLGRKNSGREGQSLPRSSFVDQLSDEDTTEGKGNAENIQFDEGFQAVGATESTSYDDGADFSDHSEDLYWPHEPRYCADVWQQDGNQDDGTVTRYLWSFPSVFLRPARAYGWHGEGGKSDTFRRTRTKGAQLSPRRYYSDGVLVQHFPNTLCC